MAKKYDYLIVGAGISGATFAQQAHYHGKSCLVIDRRSHIAGNVYSENVCGINVHKYGPHIFHTDSAEIWNYVNQFAEFNNFVNSPVARYHNEIYNLPFNMNTFVQLWGSLTPAEAKRKINSQRKKYSHIVEPNNLEEHALSLVGDDIYNRLIKGYTEKQWGRPATELPQSIIKRIPFRMSFDNNYFNHRFQGVPIGGYTAMVGNMLRGLEVVKGVDYFDNRGHFDSLATQTVYTGKIDEFFDYRFGRLEYRSLHFETEQLDTANAQGNAVVNYTDKETPFTRIVEHKHFEPNSENRYARTIITKEYPRKYTCKNEPFYPVNNIANNNTYSEYKRAADAIKTVTMIGRLAEYKYYDMHDAIERALKVVRLKNCGEQ